MKKYIAVLLTAFLLLGITACGGESGDSSAEERAVELGEYILKHKATVRLAAKKFHISKSTVHTVVTIWNGLYG